MIKIKHLILGLVLVAIATSLFFFVRYELKLRQDLRQLRFVEVDGQLVPTRNIVIYTAERQALLEDFIFTNFPDEVKTFNESLKSKQP